MIYYVGNFENDGVASDRCVSLAASDLFKYIFSVLVSLKVDKVCAIDNAPVVKKFGYFKSETVETGNSMIATRPFLNIGRISRFFQNKFQNVWIGHYLNKNLKKGDVLVVYHSLSYASAVSKVAKKKQCSFILNVEEVYSDAASVRDEKMAKKEFELFGLADSFIFASEVLANKIAGNRKYAIVYGPYKPNRLDSSKFSDGKTHLVYAGTFSTVKGGLYMALRSLPFLPQNYVIHILGSDDSSIAKKMSEDLQISDRVFFEGSKTGKSLLDFLSKCDVGLATQRMDGVFNLTSFPSKIITYLSCDLPVVSSASASVINSSIAKELFIYDKDDPELIAQTILNISKEKRCASELVANLNRTFSSQLLELIKK